MFELSPPRDLVLPTATSTTSRAVHSIARRGLFERWKSLPPDERGRDAGRAAYVALHDALSSFLPGDPHFVSHLFDMPPVSIALRMLRDRVGDPDLVHAELGAQGFFALACESRLARDVVVDVAPPSLVSLDRRLLVPITGTRLLFRSSRVIVEGREVALETLAPSHDLAPVEGRLVLSLAPTSTTRLLSLEPPALDVAAREHLVATLRRALDRLRELAPALRVSFDRFVREVVPLHRAQSSATVPTPQGIGVLTVASDADDVEALRTLVVGTVEHALLCVAEHDRLFAHDATERSVDPRKASPFRALSAAASDAAWTALVEAARARRDPRLADFAEREYADVRKQVGEAAAELARLGPTEVGMGIVDELDRFARGAHA